MYTIRDGQSVLRSLIGPDRSLGNFQKSNKAVLPIFCGTIELIKDWKVANFGLNPITQFRPRQVFILPKPVFFAFFSFLPILCSVGPKKRSIKAKFWHLLVFSHTCCASKIRGCNPYNFPKDRVGQDPEEYI